MVIAYIDVHKNSSAKMFAYPNSVVLFNMATLSFLALPYKETLFIRYIVNIVNLKIYFFLASGVLSKKNKFENFVICFIRQISIGYTWRFICILEE